MYICWENPKYSGNSLDLVYFYYRIQQGLLLLLNTSNIHSLGIDLDKEGNNPNTQENCPK